MKFGGSRLYNPGHTHLNHNPRLKKPQKDKMDLFALRDLTRISEEKFQLLLFIKIFNQALNRKVLIVDHDKVFF